jgi:hypothetical protein
MLWSLWRKIKWRKTKEGGICCKACEDRPRKGGYAVKPVKTDQVKTNQRRGDML